MANVFVARGLAPRLKSVQLNRPMLQRSQLSEHDSSKPKRRRRNDTPKPRRFVTSRCRHPPNSTGARTTSPSIEPVTLAEAKHHARVDISDDDTYIQTLIAVAREYVEDRLDTTLLTTIWEARYDEFPLWEIVLPRPPMLSATVTITYKDTEGASQTLTSSNHQITERP